MFEGEISIALPWPPSVNNYWQRGSNGHVFLSKRAEEYRAKVIELIDRFNLQLGIDVFVEVDIVMHPPTRRKCDIDNFKKGLYDALTHSNFWKDDSLVRKDTTTFGGIKKGGLITLKIKRLEYH